MTKALRIPEYLCHILNAIDRIGRYTSGMNELEFLDNELVQDAVIRNIEIIGEASNNIQRVDAEFAAQHDDILWLVMYTMRNRVSHGYDKIDLELVWRTLQGNLPNLHAQISALSASLLPADN